MANQQPQGAGPRAGVVGDVSAFAGFAVDTVQDLKNLLLAAGFGTVAGFNEAFDNVVDKIQEGVGVKGN